MLDLRERIELEELRNVQGKTKKWQLIDFLGIGLGVYFIVEAMPRKKNLNTAFGMLMVAVHSNRFFYGSMKR